MEEQSNLFSDEIKVDDVAKGHIRGMATWAMIIVGVAVLGYLLNIVVNLKGSPAIVMPATEGFSSNFIPTEKSMGAIIVSILIGLAINYFLFRFGYGASNAIKKLDQEGLSKSFRHLKIYFAILTIALILGCLVGLIAVVSVLFK